MTKTRSFARSFQGVSWGVFDLFLACLAKHRIPGRKEEAEDEPVYSFLH